MTKKRSRKRVGKGGEIGRSSKKSLVGDGKGKQYRRCIWAGEWARPEERGKKIKHIELVDNKTY